MATKRRYSVEFKKEAVRLMLIEGRSTAELADELERWIDAHYRSELTPADLADPQLLDESRRALDELTELLGLGAIYEFQR